MLKKKNVLDLDYIPAQHSDKQSRAIFRPRSYFDGLYSRAHRHKSWSGLDL